MLKEYPIRKLLRFWDKNLIGRIADSLDFDELRKARIATALVVIAPPFLCIWGVRHLMRDDLFMGYFNLGYGAAVIASFLVQRFLRPNKSVTVIYRLHAALMWAELFLLLLRSVNDPSEILWLFIYPIVVFFLLSNREGLLWVLSLYAAAIVFLLVPGLFGVSNDFSSYFVIGFIGSYLFVVAIGYASESARKKYQAETEAQQVALKVEAEKLAEAKKTAESATRAKSDFLASMSHELRTPLNHIIGFTDLLSTEELGRLNDTQREYLDHVQHSSRHLLSLINDTLDLSKVEAGKMKIEAGEIHLKDFLDSCVSSFGEKAKQQNIDISLIMNGAPEKVTADERKLKQIIFNLLSNAVKFTPQGGSVKIKVRSGISKNGDGSTPALEISVKDTGIGIKREDIGRIFSAFEQVENELNYQHPGTGLGLSLVQRLVELHGGKVRAESDGPGKGTTISFAIPASSRTDS